MKYYQVRQSKDLFFFKKLLTLKKIVCPILVSMKLKQTLIFLFLMTEFDHTSRGIFEPSILSKDTYLTVRYLFRTKWQPVWLQKFEQFIFWKVISYKSLGESNDILMEANKGDYYKMIIDPKRRWLLGMLVIVSLSIVFSIGGWLLNATISNMNKNDNSYSK